MIIVKKMTTNKKNCYLYLSIKKIFMIDSEENKEIKKLLITTVIKPSYFIVSVLFKVTI